MVTMTMVALGSVALFGAGKTAHAGYDFYTAENLNKSAEELVRQARERMEHENAACQRALEILGEEKSQVLTGSIAQFLDTFQKLKNVEFLTEASTEDLTAVNAGELKPAELHSLMEVVGSLVAGTAAGAAGGALAAFGSYGAAQIFACASTGTAISSLSGAAATNATLAFFGGGSLAAGGAGMAGGALVLGGIVAAPALLAMGFIAGSKASQNLEKAKIRKAEALEIDQESLTYAAACHGIRKRIYEFYNLLAQLDSRLQPLVYQMEEIVKKEGVDYALFTPASKKVIASAASTVSTISMLLKAPILTEEGTLSDQSETAVEEVSGYLEKNPSLQQS